MLSRLEQEHFTKMNLKSANTWLTDMINISIESFKLLLNEINQIENKNSFIIIREDALLSKGASNEEMGVRIIIWFFIFATKNTSLLVNNSNISLLFPPDTLMVITFAGALWQALLGVFEAELFSCADGSLLLLDSKHRDALDSRSSAGLVLFPPARQFFSSLIDGCLKVWIMTWKLARLKPGRGRAEMQGSSVPLGRNHVSPSGGPLPSWALRIVLTFPPFTAPLDAAAEHCWETHRCWYSHALNLSLFKCVRLH